MSDPTQIPGANPPGGDDERPPADATIVPADATQLSQGAPSPAAAPPRRASGVAADKSGDRIGEYTLIEKLGAGGFGVVWKAERREPFVQQVALKLLKPGLDSEEVLARFELERQALALMDHPNIAKVIDGGVTETGRSYFVMELVRGEPIDRFCDTNRLGLRQRLELFAQVCDAVHHAHMKGIIHRDLKPGNILAGMSGDTGGSGATSTAGIRVKVIDFGVAKATSATSVAHEVFTQTGQMIGTPAYMSPEQLDGRNDIDTRADVYSLGMVLYELLVGAPAFDPQTLRAAGLAEINRIIREQEPPKLTTRLAQLSDGKSQAASSAADIAKARGLQPDTLVRSLRGELEWLPMKAASKDRNRRYRSAAEFADDVRNYLEGKPLIAGPETAVYRVGKFVRRHRTGVGAGIAVAVSLIAATVLSTWFGIREARAREAETVARQLAERRERETRQIAEFQEAMLSGIDPSAAGQALVTAIESRLDRALASEGVSPTERLTRVDGLRRAMQSANATDVATDFLDGVVLAPAVGAATTQFRDQPDVESALKQSLGITYYKLGQYARAGAPVADAIRVRTATIGPDARPTLESGLWGTRISAAAATTAKDRDAVEAPFKQAIEAMRRGLGDADPLTLFAMRCYAEWLDEQHRRDDAVKVYEQALALASGKLDPLSDTVILLTTGLAYTRIEEGQLERAIELLMPMREAMARMKDASPRLQLVVLRHLATARSRLAGVRPTPELVQAAETAHREAIDLASRTLGDEHPLSFKARNNLANLLFDVGRKDDAGRLFEQGVSIGRARPGTGGVDFLIALVGLGQAKAAKGDLAGAEPLLAEAELGFRSARGMDVRETQGIVLSHARLLLAQKRHDDAIARMREVLARQVATIGPSEIDTIDTARELGRALAMARRFADADAEFTKNEAAIDSAKRPPTSDARWALVNQWKHSLEAWRKSDPKAPVAGRMPAVTAKIDQLKQARLAANPPLPIDWKDE